MIIQPEIEKGKCDHNATTNHQHMKKAVSALPAETACHLRKSVDHSVGVRGFNLNPALAAYLRERQEAINSGAEHACVEPKHTPIPQRRPLSARLSDAQITAIVARYCSGETARRLAAEYGVGLTAMKSLLRKQGARKR